MIPKQENQFDDLLSSLGSRTASTAPSANRSATILQHCTSELKPAAGMTRGQRVISCALLGLLIISSLALVRFGVAGHQVANSALYGTAAWALVLLSVLLVGFGPQGSQTSTWRIAAAFGVPVLFFAYLTMTQSNILSLGAFLSDGHAHASAVSCAVKITALGVICAAGVLYVWRRTDPFNPKWSGALAGLTSGLAGALAVGLVCPDSEGWHLWLGHGLSVIVLVMVGASIGRRVLTP